MLTRRIVSFTCSALLGAAGFVQTVSTAAAQEPDRPMPEMKAEAPTAKKPLASPAETAEVSLDGKKVDIRYNAPSARGRKIMGEVVPYGKVWRTGANPATTLVTAVNLKIGTLTVPAGAYTLYTLPTADAWMLIVNKQTGQWGTVYKEDMDLGRTAMIGNPLAKPQETMSISFENTKGNATELHVKWESTDRFVTITAQ